jgi:hypothetical protein
LSSTSSVTVSRSDLEKNKELLEAFRKWLILQIFLQNLLM